MYFIDSNGKIIYNYENFINCDNKNFITNDSITVNNSNQIKNINIDCLVVPSKVFNGFQKKPFILSTVNRDCTDTTCSKGGHHSFQIFPFNLPNNIIYVDTIKPNFFSIINTINMKPNGKIVLLHRNSKIKIINIKDLNNNNNKILARDSNGNLCRDPDDKKTLTKFNSRLEVTTLEYKNNPVIYFFGDYEACNIGKKNLVNKLYVYFDYENKKDTQSCLNKMFFTNMKSGNNKKDFLLPYTMHGTQYNDYISRNFIINFDPREISSKDGFLTIINTKKSIEKFQETKSIFQKFLEWKIKNNNGTILEYYLKNINLKDEILNFIYNYTPSENSNDKIDLFVLELSNIILNLENSPYSSEMPPYSSEMPPYSSEMPSYSSEMPSYSSEMPPYSSEMPPYSSESPFYISEKNKESLENQTNLKGSIMFNSKLLNTIKLKKRNCLYINFWLTSFDFKNTKIFEFKDRKGPYKQIDFVGNPKLIIYIPPYLFKNEIDQRLNSISSYYQTNENVCDIYISVIY
jgi:hypothetical protein